MQGTGLEELYMPNLCSSMLSVLLKKYTFLAGNHCHKTAKRKDSGSWLSFHSGASVLPVTPFLDKNIKMLKI